MVNYCHTMKILHILPHLNIGGITTYVYTLSKYLIRNNIEVAVASRGGSWENRFREIGIKTFKISTDTKSELSYKVILSVIQLRKIKREFDFDIIHSHTRLTQVIAQIFSDFYKTPHIANFHGFYKNNKRRIGRKIFKAQGIRAIAITPEVKDDLINVFGADKDRVKVILSAIDIEELSKESPPIHIKGMPKIGTSGRLSSVKGFEYLIKSMPVVLDRYPESHLYILGEGKEERNLRKLSETLGIKDKVRLLKKIPLASFLKSIDIFCLPSLEEPLGLSVLEAQYFGIPCVVSNTGGLRLLVKNEKTGLLVPPADSKSIADALIRIESDKNLKRLISLNSKKQVENNFDIRKRIGKFINVYKLALGL